MRLMKAKSFRPRKATGRQRRQQRAYFLPEIGIPHEARRILLGGTEKSIIKTNKGYFLEISGQEAKAEKRVFQRVSGAMFEKAKRL